jgi:hypothetical protein
MIILAIISANLPNKANILGRQRLRSFVAQSFAAGDLRRYVLKKNGRIDSSAI